MLELLCGIPESVGWVAVGVLGTITTIVGLKDCKIIYTIIRDHFTDDDDDEIE